jgi:outer membrane biosynthesis protein TonB
MKRCPQCEFIYEDDQSLCDMDGVLLVLDSRTLPNHHALATVPAAPKTQRRNRAVPVFATVILALVLAMVYYVSTRPGAAPQTYSPASVTSTSNPAPVSNPTPEAQPSESPKEEVAEAEPKSATTKQPAVVAPAKKPAAKTAPVSQTKTATPPKKEESKVGSILKKTGRILKKPFKF